MPKSVSKTKFCETPDCAEHLYARGMCFRHYQWAVRHGEIVTSPGSGAPGVRRKRKNERHLSKSGYWRVRRKDNDRWDMEHRIVMESIVGRVLLKTERVHHRNGVRTDNRPKNLELWVRSHPDGQRVEDLVAWAKEILELYG